MIPLGPVVARSRVRAPRAAVWATVTDPELRKTWWPELHLEPRIGGAVSERWTETSGETAVSRDASGDVDVWVEGHAIGFRWSEAGDAHSTAVLVTLRSQGPETGITVTETGFDVLPAPAERAAASQEGWQVLLGDLVASVEAAVAAGTFATVDTAAADVADTAAGGVADSDVADTAAVDSDVVAQESVSSADADLADPAADDAAAGDDAGADDADNSEPSAEVAGAADVADADADAAADSEAADADADAADADAADSSVADSDAAGSDGADADGADSDGAEAPEDKNSEDSADAGTLDGDVSNETVQIERLDPSEPGATPDTATGSETDPDDADEPDEPDFDTLIRGPQSS